MIVIVQRIPAGAFRCKSNVPVQYLDMLVLRTLILGPLHGYAIAKSIGQLSNGAFEIANVAGDITVTGRR